jgi:hypothetical protein
VAGTKRVSDYARKKSYGSNIKRKIMIKFYYSPITGLVWWSINEAPSYAQFSAKRKRRDRHV